VNYPTRRCCPPVTLQAPPHQPRHHGRRPFRQPVQVNLSFRHLRQHMQRGLSVKEPPATRLRGAGSVAGDGGLLGIGVDLVPTEVGALIEQIMSMNFDAIYLGFLLSDTDPAGNLDFWLSSGAAHFWNPSQVTPATEWEARIDQLAAEQLRASDMDRRVELFDEIQAIAGENQPLLYFAAPRLSVATSVRITNVAPSLMRPHVLWNADTLAIADRD
jgi:ABC-type transport system substrate-binding protein